MMNMTLKAREIFNTHVRQIKIKRQNQLPFAFYSHGGSSKAKVILLRLWSGTQTRCEA